MLSPCCLALYEGRAGQTDVAKCDEERKFAYLTALGHASAEMNTIYTHRELAPLRAAVEKLPSTGI